MILNKYSTASKQGTVIGSYSSKKSGSSGSSSGSNRATLDRVIWGQDDDGSDLDGDLICGGNMYVITSTDDEDDEDESKYIASGIATLSADVSGIFDDEDGGNHWVEKQLKVGKNIEAPEIYGKEVFLDYNSKKTNILDLILPVGSIIMFNGQTAIPNGWAICNGSTVNGITTPNLVDKFIKGVGKIEDVGKTGGASTVTLTTDNLPSHNHTATTNINLSINQGTPEVQESWKEQKIITYHDTYYQAFDMGGDKHYTAESGYESPQDKGIVEIGVQDLLNAAGGVSGSATATTTIGNTGSGTAFNIEPNYYTLVYIMKIS